MQDRNRPFITIEQAARVRPDMEVVAKILTGEWLDAVSGTTWAPEQGIESVERFIAESVAPDAAKVYGGMYRRVDVVRHASWSHALKLMREAYEAKVRRTRKVVGHAA